MGSKEQWQPYWRKKKEKKLLLFIIFLSLSIMKSDWRLYYSLFQVSHQAIRQTPVFAMPTTSALPNGWHSVDLSSQTLLIALWSENTPASCQTQRDFAPSHTPIATIQRSCFTLFSIVIIRVKFTKRGNTNALDSGKRKMDSFILIPRELTFLAMSALWVWPLIKTRIWCQKLDRIANVVISLKSMAWHCTDKQSVLTSWKSKQCKSV